MTRLTRAAEVGAYIIGSASARLVFALSLLLATAASGADPAQQGLLVSREGTVDFARTTNALDTSGLWNFSEPIGTNRQRFYRAREAE